MAVPYAYRMQSLTTRLAQPRDVDVALALGVLVLGLFEALGTAPNAPSWAQAALTGAWSAPLVWRRRRPVPILALVALLGPVLGTVNPVGGVNSYALAAVVAAYTVGREHEAPTSWWGPGLILGINWPLLVVVGGQLSDFVFITLIYGGAWAVGQVIRTRDVRVTELARTADELRREQALLARELEQERARIARELHDIVAHSISVVAIQTQAIRRRLGPEHPREIEDLRALEETARDAMGELRRMLGVLRADERGASLEPQPGIDQLPRLLDEARAAGTRVVAEVEQPPRDLPAGLGLTVFRVVQEALTNVRKHAPRSAAHVSIAYGPGDVAVRIANEGSRDAVAEPGTGHGHGLLGMRERVSLYDGSMTAEPRPEGGFAVTVRLPLPPSDGSPP